MKHALAAVAVLSAMVLGAQPASAINCVAYVKAVTGFSLMGDAWQWWGAAEHVYERGYAPAPGAVMVFSRTARMHVGHVALVSRIVSNREILIDQANWHHGLVDRGVSVHDLSLANDWSSVEVEWTKGVYGGPFPITGFVYAPGTPRQADRPHLVEAAYRVPQGHVVMAGGRSLAEQARPALHLAGAHVVHLASHAAPVAATAKTATPSISHALAAKAPAVARPTAKAAPPRAPIVATMVAVKPVVRPVPKRPS